MTLHALDEPTVSLPHLAPRHVRSSTVLVVGRFFDWLGITVMALLVCAFICQQGFGAIRTVETAAELPLDVATAALSSADQHGSGERYVERTEWTQVGHLRSLRVYPTEAGRRPIVNGANMIESRRNPGGVEERL